METINIATYESFILMKRFNGRYYCAPEYLKDWVLWYDEGNEPAEPYEGMHNKYAVIIECRLSKTDLLKALYGNIS